jgi:hypothetical protein
VVEYPAATGIQTIVEQRKYKVPLDFAKDGPAQINAAHVSHVSLQDDITSFGRNFSPSPESNVGLR